LERHHPFRVRLLFMAVVAEGVVRVRVVLAQTGVAMEVDNRSQVGVGERQIQEEGVVVHTRVVVQKVRVGLVFVPFTHYQVLLHQLREERTPHQMVMTFGRSHQAVRGFPLSLKLFHCQRMLLLSSSQV